MRNDKFICHNFLPISLEGTTTDIIIIDDGINQDPLIAFFRSRPEPSNPLSPEELAAYPTVDILNLPFVSYWRADLNGGDEIRQGYVDQASGWIRNVIGDSLDKRTNWIRHGNKKFTGLAVGTGIAPSQGGHG